MCLHHQTRLPKVPSGNQHGQLKSNPPDSPVTPGRVTLLRQIGQSTIILATARDRQNLNFKRIKLPFLLSRLWSTSWKIQPQGSGSNAQLSESHNQFLKPDSVVNFSN